MPTAAALAKRWNDFTIAGSLGPSFSSRDFAACKQQASASIMCRAVQCVPCGQAVLQAACMLLIEMRLVNLKILSVASSSFGGRSSAGSEMSHLEHTVQHIQQGHFLLAGSW